MSIPSPFSRRFHAFAPRLAAAVALVLGTSQAARATDLWVGNTSPNWGDATNWSDGTAPTDFEDVAFGVAGSSGTTLNNNLTEGISLSGIAFNAGASAFTLNGNGITLNGPVTNNSVVLQTVNLPITLLSQQTFTTTAGGGDLRIGGLISGLGGGVTKANAGTGTAGTLTLANPANTYTGETVFGTGITNVATLADYGVPSSLGARLAADETAVGSGISLHFRGGTLQYTGSTPQSTNREIRVLNGVTGGTIDASGSTPTATLSFTHTGPNINLFDTPGTRTLNLVGTNTGRNSFSIQLTDQSTSQTSLRKAGTGTWFILNTDNPFTGETIFAGGILNVASISDYGVVSSIGGRPLALENTTVTGVSLHFQGGTLQYTGSTPQSTNRNIRILNGNGGTIDASGSTPEATLSFTHTGANINLFDTGGTRTLTLTGTNTGSNTFSIQLTNQSGNATGLTKTGPGKWIVNGPDANTATGTTTVTGGTLVLAKTDAVAASGPVTIGDGVGTDVLQIGGTGGNQIADSSIVTLSGSGANAGILRLSGLNETIGGLTGAGIVENEAGAAGTATLTVNAAGSSAFSGVLRDGDGTGTDGALALTKLGAGTLILSGTSTHTGATTVSAGTLTVDGTLGAGTTVTVTNATLNGSGTVASTVNAGSGGIVNSTGAFTGIVNLSSGSVLNGTSTMATVNAGSGAHISPGTGNQLGTLTIASLKLASGSILDFEFGAANDLVNVTGAGGLALNGGAFNLFAAGGTTPLLTNGDYTLIDYNTSFTGSLANLSIANSQVGKFYNLINDTANTLIKLTVADATTTEWKGTGGDNLWTTAGNWTSGIPNSPGAVAKLGTIPTAPTTIAVSGAKTVGGMLFDNTNSYTVAGGAGDVITLNNGVAAASITVNSGSHTISAPLVLATSANATTAANTTLRLTGNVSGAGGLIASGGGTTVLTGTNSFSTTTLSGGTLQVGDGGTTGTLGTGDVTVQTGATLVFNRSDSFALTNNLTGGGAQVTKLGAGTLTLSGINTFATGTGSGFNLNAGTVKLGSATALASGVVLGFNGGTLDLNGNSVISSFLTGATGTITDNGAGAGTSTLTVNQTASAAYGGTIADGPSRLVALTKGGTGTLTLTGNNTFTGPLTITGGAVISAGTGGSKPIIASVTLGNGSSAVMLTAGSTEQQFGAGTVVSFNNGSRDAKLQLRGSSQTLAGIDANADSSVTLAIIQNDETGTPGFTVAPGPATLTLNTTTDHSFTGYIRNQVGGGISLVKEGPATQEIRNALIGTNVLTGVTVNAGKLRFNYIPNGVNTNTFASGTAASGSQPVALVTGPNGTLAFAGTTVVPGQTVDAATGAVTAVGATITNAGTLLSEGSNTVTINSPISGPGNVVIAGTGTTTLGGANTFTGNVILNSGILGVGNNQALSAPTVRIIINGGNLRAAGATREIPNPVTVNGSFTLGRQTNLNSGLTLTADATLTADNPDTTFNTTSALGPVTGPFKLTIQQGAFGMGAGAIIINGENSNSGGTQINSGRVNVSETGYLAGSSLTVNGGELNLNNSAQTVASFAGTGGAVNLQFNHTLTVNQAANTEFSGALGGGGMLAKRGAGTLTLSGTSANFTGTATVNEGTLLVNGSINGTVLADGATAVLGGTGSVSSITAGNGATINPGGPGAGIFSSMGDLTLSSGTKLRLELNNPAAGTGYDQLSVLGTVSLNDATLNLGGSYVPSTPGALFFVVANEGFGPVLGTFAGLAEGSNVVSSSGARFVLTYQADSLAGTFTGGNDIALRAIPEPGSAALLLLGGTALLGLRRRGKHGC